jgi:Flp pilus assembly protein TadG
MWNGSSTRRASQVGAVMVEFIIIFPLVMALALGGITFGNAYSRKLSAQNAAREGARYGATLPVSNFADTAAWLDDVEAVTAASVSEGSVPSDLVVCVAINTGSGFTNNSGGSAACYADARGSEPRVQVHVTRTANINFMFFARDTTLQSQAVARYEVASA